MLCRRLMTRLTRGFRLTLVPAVACVLAITACSSPDSPTAPSTSLLIPNKPSAAISDGTQGNGNSHFYWLPPIAPSGAYAGTFDPGLQPEIRICRVAALLRAPCR
jgi:hypothetical protein